MKILIIEDECILANNISAYLTQENYLCEHAETIKEAEEKLLLHDYDCILVDNTLPDGDPLKFVTSLRQQSKKEGIIITSTTSTVDERINGLNLGADDYMAKPVHLAELSARISSVIRRNSFEGSNMIRIKELGIDLLAKTVTANGKSIDVTRKEFGLLLFVVSNKNKLLTKNAIAEHLSGDYADSMDNFDFIYSHIKNLKKKLMDAGCSDYIRNVYGRGYKFQA